MTTKKTDKKGTSGTGAKKASTRKPSVRKTGTQPKVTPQGVPIFGKISKNKHFTARQLKKQLQRLLQLRQRVSGEIVSINRDTLSQIEREVSAEDQGTDTFDRDFALQQLSNEQNVLFEIDEAIHRLGNGSYGICEMTGEPINIERLETLPYVRYSIKAQAEIEKSTSMRRM